MVGPEAGRKDQAGGCEIIHHSAGQSANRERGRVMTWSSGLSATDVTDEHTWMRVQLGLCFHYTMLMDQANLAACGEEYAFQDALFDLYRYFPAEVECEGGH